MRKSIVILEDNQERIDEMKSWLGDRLYMYDHFFSDDPSQIIQELLRLGSNVLAVSLDHDLNERLDVTGKADPTGMQVVDFLETQKADFPVLVHSTNTVAATRMVKRLKQSDWKVKRIIPFNDLDWIGSEWMPTLRKVISDQAVPQVELVQKQ